jgi:hypothetical protein
MFRDMPLVAPSAFLGSGGEPSPGPAPDAVYSLRASAGSGMTGAPRLLANGTPAWQPDPATCYSELDHLMQQYAVFYVFEIGFGTVYLVLAVLCLLAIRKQRASAFRKASMGRGGAQGQGCSQFWRWYVGSNSAQVLLCALIGALTRAVTFAPMPCMANELLRVAKDSAFFAAFTVMVLFWIELQASVGKVQTLDRLRPWLYRVMVVYAACRLAQTIVEIVAPDTNWLFQVFYGATIGIYAAMLALGGFFGFGLLRKMSTLKSQGQTVQRKLVRLTRFLIFEIIVMVIWLALVGVRRLVFKSDAQSDPFSEFYVKASEKALEWLAIYLLYYTMSGTGGCCGRMCPSCCADDVRDGESTPKGSLELSSHRSSSSNKLGSLRSPSPASPARAGGPSIVVENGGREALSRLMSKSILGEADSKASLSV